MIETRHLLATTATSALIVVLVAPCALAQVPALSPGQCVYLVGAPAGAPAAATEAAGHDGIVFPICTGNAAIDEDRDRPHSLQAWCTAIAGSADDCTVALATWNEFRLDATTVTRGRVIVHGAFMGRLFGVSGV